jgi:hypothetical protein
MELGQFGQFLTNTETLELKAIQDLLLLLPATVPPARQLVSVVKTVFLVSITSPLKLSTLWHKCKPYTFFSDARPTIVTRHTQYGLPATLQQKRRLHPSDTTAPWTDHRSTRHAGASAVAVSQWSGVVIGSTSPCQKVYSLKREISTRNSMNRDVSKVGSIDKALKWNLQTDSHLFFLLKWPKLDLKSGSINGSWWWNWNWKKTWSN